MMDINFKGLDKLATKVSNNIKNDNENYGTGLLGEQIIIASYKTMPIDKLVKLRFILNKIIKKKKEMKRVIASKKKDV